MQASGTGNCFRMTIFIQAVCSVSQATPSLASIMVQVLLSYQTLGIQARLRDLGQGGY